MSIRLTKFYIENFKSIKSLSGALNFNNLFFGKNSAGKSSILKAISYAINSENITKEDVFASEIDKYDENKQVIIDLCFEPEGINEMHFSSEWKDILNDAVGTLENSSREVFAYRTVYTLNKSTGYYEIKRYKIAKFFFGGKSVVGEELQEGILGLHLHAYYLNASKSGNENLKEREEYWNALIDAAEFLKDYDYSLLPEEIKNDLLKLDMNSACQTIKEAMSDDMNGASSVLVFETMKKQIETVYKCLKPFHSIYLIEEPEAHLHPQAQMQIMKIINETPGQKYIATHSSYVVNHFPIHKLIRVVNDGNGTKMYKFDNRLSMKELKTINLKCMLYKAEMIFANKVVLFEGQTEHIALPLYFNKYFGSYPFENGYSFVYVEGSNNYKAYLEICNAFHIDWCIYSDGEQVVIDFLNKMMCQLTNKSHYDVTKDNHFVIIKNNMCYEDDLIYHGFSNDVSEAIDYKEKTKNYIKDRLLKSYSWRQFKQESKKYNPNEDEFKQGLSYYSKRHKIDLAESVAKTVCRNHDREDLPSSVLELFKKIS